MRKSAKKSFVIIAACFLIVAFMATGCSRYANEKQLQQLDETQAAALSAEQRVAELESEKAKLEADLAEKMEELKYVENEKKKIQSVL